jgi:Phage tail sheath protein subtilisin-like domain/Phage tail sheath C-terminal domain
VANERIVSPGVFTNEMDQSFLPQGIGAIGAALVGPTLKGPAFVPTMVEGYADFVTKFGGSYEQSYLPYTAKSYLNNAGSATIVRVLGSGGYSLKHPIAIVATGSWGKKLISFLHPTFVVTDTDSTSLFAKSLVTSNASGSFVLNVSGTFTTDTSTFTNATSENGIAFSASINPENTAYIGDIYGYNPYGTHAVYNYVNFKKQASASIAADGATTILIETGSAGSPWDFTNDYLEASTPWVTSQKVGSFATNLFKFSTLSHGIHSNYEVKVGISNIRPAGTIAGSLFGDFDVIVRNVDQSKLPTTPFTFEDDDLRPAVIEQFKCNLDPNSPKFIGRVIGDRYITVTDEGKVVVNGDYSNKSKYIRVEVTEGVKNGGVSENLVPFGFRALKSPIPSAFTQPAATTYVTDQTAGSAYNRRVYWGFNFDFANTDNFNYLRSLPIVANQSTGSNVDFYLGNFQQNPGASFPSSATAYSSSIDLTTNTALDSRKFIVPFQGGFDGHKPNLQKKVGYHILAGNTQGFDVSNTSASGYTSYKKAIDAISNADEFDINMVVAPGLLHTLHSAVTTYAKDMCENRGDAFYVMDANGLEDNISTATSATEGFDSNYAATYYPWVKILDSDRNKPIWVPPSVVLPGVIAFNDRVSAEWFAPAGLNRGGLTEVVEVRSRLTQSERDTLYEARINPIAVFPSTGVCVWGQKTLQGRPSALDRINVRRLLIAAKKFIASSTRYLVFEQNTSQTRTRFLNIVTPYLESIQQRQGIYAFRVIMDESNNTPDIIDRNILYGQLFLQPAKTAEFIILDFNIQSTGAAFPGA